MRQQYTFELYHENSKLRSGDIDLYTWIGYVNSDPSIRNVISKPTLEYGGILEIALPEISGDDSMSLYQTLLARRSQRDFGSAECSLEAFSALLGVAIRENVTVNYEDGVSWSFRSYPSGGGLYPVDIYIYVNNVATIEKGIYFYNPKKHTITAADNIQEWTRMGEALPTLEDAISQCSFMIFLVSDLSKIAFKYQERAYRFALLECGHIAQNLLLTATSLRLKSFPAGAYMDDSMNALLNLDGVSSNIQYILFFGT